MAVFGIGASYERDVSLEFINKRLACVGWKREVAHPLHNLMKHIKTGDIIYIKSHPPHIGLIIKAVGIVIGQDMKQDELGTCVSVEWVWRGTEQMGKLKDKYPVRNMTLYEEYNFLVQTRVIELLLQTCHRTW